MQNLEGHDGDSATSRAKEGIGVSIEESVVKRRIAQRTGHPTQEFVTRAKAQAFIADKVRNSTAMKDAPLMTEPEDDKMTYDV